MCHTHGHCARLYAQWTILSSFMIRLCESLTILSQDSFFFIIFGSFFSTGSSFFRLNKWRKRSGNISNCIWIEPISSAEPTIVVKKLKNIFLKVKLSDASFFPFHSKGTSKTKQNKIDDEKKMLSLQLFPFFFRVIQSCEESLDKSYRESLNFSERCTSVTHNQ